MSLFGRGGALGVCPHSDYYFYYFISNSSAGRGDFGGSKNPSRLTATLHTEYSGFHLTSQKSNLHLWGHKLLCATGGWTPQYGVSRPSCTEQGGAVTREAAWDGKIICKNQPCGRWGSNPLRVETAARSAGWLAHARPWAGHPQKGEEEGKRHARNGGPAWRWIVSSWWGHKRRRPMAGRAASLASNSA
jgi:hypothetical protein